jgi:RNA polymerase sigma factor (sigma-70 family)
VKANMTARGFTEHLETLFGAGTCVGLTDGQLLARFMAGRDEAGELAFEVLVTRHGPMVLRVCRNILDDPQDVHDAFQAVFLVLARRAGAIRNRESVGSWLHGVAVQVTARVRLGAIRRGIRDRRTNQVAATLAAAGPRRTDEFQAERHDGAEVVHQEVSRLPDKYRAPIILCYLEGLTHDEAAARLSWPVGTVRSRLARARDTLRDRLTRRGVTSLAVLGPLTGWLAGEQVAPSATAVAIHGELVASTAKAVSLFSAARNAAGVSVTSPSLLLAQGVLKTMLLKKLIVTACALIPLGMIAMGGGMFLARQSQAQVQDPLALTPINNSHAAATKDEPKPVDPLVEELLQAARQLYDAQRAYYEEGRITIDRFLDASAQLGLAELRTAQTRENRLATAQRHIDRLKEIERREKAELDAGRATVADVAEAHYQRVQAEVDLKFSQGERSDIDSILQRLSNLERKVKELQDANRGTSGR